MPRNRAYSESAQRHPEDRDDRSGPGMDLQGMLDALRAERAQAGLARESPLAELADEFFANNWDLFCNGLLKQIEIMRVVPEPSPAPRQFHFELDRPYKRKASANSPVELAPGPVRGLISYRPDLFEAPDVHHVMVQIDPRLGYLHPNCARHFGGMVCLGELPEYPYPLPLDMLIINHIYPILTYQNMTPSDSMDPEAAMYFALEAEAMDGLRPVPPLY